MSHPEIESLLDLLDQAFDRKAWHGPNLLGALRGLTAAAASYRPSKRRHSCWELAVHAAYWKYAVRRRITGEKRGSFPLEGSNWFPSPARADARAWRSVLALLREQHRLLRAVIARFPAAKLGRRGWRSKWTNEEHIYGIASHDLYHAGQVQLIKRLVS